MNKDNIKQMLIALGTSPNSSGSKWVSSPCALAPWLHYGGQDLNPSFGIKADDHKTSRFHCFTCNSGGTTLDLVLEIASRNKIDPKPRAFNIQKALKLAEADTNEDDDFTPMTYEEMIQSEPPAKVTPFPESYLDGFKKVHTHPYLEERKVSPEVAQALDIRFDIGRQRICFPFRDKFGQLAGVQGRAIDQEHPLRYYQYGLFIEGEEDPIRNSIVWMNEDKMDLDLPIILTEGPFDVARIMELYPNAIASFTSGLSYEKMKRIRDAEQIITLYDYGKGGDTARKTLDKYFDGIIHLIPREEVGDVGAMDLDELDTILSDIGLTQ